MMVGRITIFLQMLTALGRKYFFHLSLDKAHLAKIPMPPSPMLWTSRSSLFLARPCKTFRICVADLVEFETGAAQMPFRDKLAMVTRCLVKGPPGSRVGNTG
ncbi:MAG: hypothetical protein CMM47_09685 [Rhodospirillaceae bacterium]|nr:hypothetical protein [Rhodospirillaceae bacterium]